MAASASATTMLLKYPTTICGVSNNNNESSSASPKDNNLNIPQQQPNTSNPLLKFRTQPNKLVTNAVAAPVFPSSTTTTTTPSSINQLVHEFDPKIPAEDAFTPPSTWYTEPAFYSHELERIFYKGWQVAGISEHVKEKNQYFTGRLGNVEYVVSRDGEGKVHAFHNVCTHRASILACGSGKKSCFVCPYHGWVFGMDGELTKATQTTDAQTFDAKEYGLSPLKVAEWGPFILISLDKDLPEGDVGTQWLGSSAEAVKAHAFDPSLKFINRSEFPMDCNWKVFCDNYMDSSYHVPYAHKYYATELDFDTYDTQMDGNVTIQRVASNTNRPDGVINRLGEKAFYAFAYPNFAVERYGPWMTTMHVHPIAQRKCKLVVDYYIEDSLLEHKDYIEKGIAINDNVQREDKVLCESVQVGLETPAYRSGRYVMPIEKGIHHFHCWLHQILK